MPALDPIQCCYSLAGVRIGFRWREDGKQKTLYLGKTDEPEAVVDETLS